MKKLLSTLMVIACLALAIPAQAQIKAQQQNSHCLFLV